ncbi:MAG: GDSL-type esterase/lipase family protein [Clostridia bacterium]|nr:GDSL-type esterase/lipase family protein [Clostridia bacterium]
MLENTLYKLQHGEPVTIAYFGGSITEGAGSTSYDKCWAGLTTAWLREKFPACKITGIQAAIGGTGSTLGVYRCDENVVAYHPDIVLYEYDCNNSYDEFMPLANNCDAILRKLWRADPYTDVVMIYTSTKAMSATIKSGSPLASRTAHSAVAYYYGGIPQIDIGEVLRYRVISEGGNIDDEADWKRYTRDTVHPTDDGYAIYEEAIQKHLTEVFEKAGTPDKRVPRVIDKPLFGEDSRVDARMTDAFTAELGKGFSRVEDKTLCNRYKHYIEATEVGSELTFTFEGTRCELYWMLAGDGGDIVYSVDGGEEMTRRAWDSYCLSFDRAGNCCLASGLAKGVHTVKLRVAETKEEQSKGHAIRIGAILSL